MSRAKQVTRYIYGAFWIAGGLNHFFNTPFYVSIMPPYLPWPLALVYLSGIAEIGLGILLLFQRWSVLAGWGLIALLVAGFRQISTWLCILNFLRGHLPQAYGSVFHCKVC